MSVALRKPMTQAEFFDWAEAQNERYEFDGFQPVLMNGGVEPGAMAGGSRNHARLTRNILVQLDRQLAKDGPCEALASDAGIQTVGDAVRYPDVVVTCSLSDGTDRLIPKPVIVFAVVSPSSTREDRILKPVEDAAVASIKRYVIVEQSVVGLTVLWRSDDEAWHFQTLKSGDTLLLPEIGVELPVDDLYERVSFTPSPEAAPPAAAPAGG